METACQLVEPRWRDLTTRGTSQKPDFSESDHLQHGGMGLSGHADFSSEESDDDEVIKVET